MVSEAQKRANERYRKANVKQTSVRFYPSERDLWDWMRAKGNAAGYIKQLIREDMERERGGA